MKKKIYFITTALAALAVLSLSSCLKDPRYVNFGQGGTVLNFPTGGLSHFGADAVTDPGDTIVKQFAVEIASPTPPSANTDVTIAVDNSIITAYTATNNTVDYQPMPDGSYTLSATKVTVPAGKRSAVITVTFYKGLLDPAKSYMLPVKIVSGPAGATVSGNYGIHYYHFIGNDFAGNYDLISSRWNATDTLGAPLYYRNDFLTYVMSPVTPTKCSVQSGYYDGIPYTITFTKTGTGGAATYSNFAVTFTADDIASYWAPAGITLGNGPNFDPAVDPAKQYTFAEAIKLFSFYYTTGSRAIKDVYIKQ